jgi:hypothetical protein
VNLFNDGNIVIILLPKQCEYAYTLTSELGQHKSDISYTCIACIRCIHVCPCVYERCDSLIMTLQGLKQAGVFIIQTTGKFPYTQCLCWLIYRKKKHNLFTTVRNLMWIRTESQIPNTECIWKKGKSVPVSIQTEVLQTALMFSLPKL